MTPAHESALILERIFPVLLGSVLDANETWRLRSAVGDFLALHDQAFTTGTFSADLWECFSLALDAGATFEGFERVRAALLAEAPTSLFATAVVQASLRFTLSCEVKVIIATTFKSRDQIERMITRMNTAFESAEMTAANDLDAASYRAIITMHATIVRDLANRERPLPRMIRLDMVVTMPTLAVANRIYADAARSDELIAENTIVHPAFAPSVLRGLSN